MLNQDDLQKLRMMIRKEVRGEHDSPPLLEQHRDFIGHYHHDSSDEIIIFSGKAKGQPSDHKVLDLDGIQAAIFDMDGTIVNNMKYHRQAWQTFLKQYGIPLSNDEFQQQFSGRWNDQIFPIVFDRYLSVEEVRFYAEEKEKIYRRLYADHIVVNDLRSEQLLPSGRAIWCGLQKNLADSYRKVGHAGNMSDVAWQASSHNLVETSSYQRNSVVFVVRMALKAGLPPVANLLVGNGKPFG